MRTQMAVGWMTWWYCVQGDAEVVVEQQIAASDGQQWDGLPEAWPVGTLLKVCDMQEEASIRYWEGATR
jgi:hypothetical protein